MLHIAFFVYEQEHSTMLYERAVAYLNVDIAVEGTNAFIHCTVIISAE